jgi:hypothetical protein
MGIQRVQTNKRKRILTWLVRWARRAGTRDFYPALAALVGPVQNIFFPHRALQYFIYVSPSHSNLARQTCRAACL